MALHGKFILNDADYSPFTLFGVGTFLAFSGSGIYRNRGACAHVLKSGPLPPGKYWIVDRGSGGFFSRLKTDIKDTWKQFIQVPCTKSLLVRGYIEGYPMGSVTVANKLNPWLRRLLKTLFFILILIIVRRSLGDPFFWVNQDVAYEIAGFLHGIENVNAETIYDTYFYIDFISVISITIVIYILTMKLLVKKRER
ncbi:MAG: DUF2778 domain-containing protein [Rouxiella aceris]|uniref:tlde1 domain-containing protein n=1 Tax=Rouxiella aceris TaxID=2703884 RepID=UPI00283B503A|nr:tlde1 domain-containing protein [Rouxiella aceris]MDR3430514.1 DUF2778 domain-containing protein [Rouxiella aceris]